LIREPKLNYKLPIIRLQFPLAFDARVLSEVVSREVSLGKIVYGENYATLKVKTSALATDVRKLTDKIGTLLAGPSPPDLVLNRHCAECKFQNRSWIRSN